MQRLSRSMRTPAAEKQKWFDVVLGIVCAAALILKVVLLLTSQSIADGDEAVVGLMALHVVEDGEHPLFVYGQAYDMGAALLAHLAAGVFLITGPSSLSLKATALLVWVLMVVVLMMSLWRWLGRHAALLGVTLMLCCPSATEWAMKARGHVPATLATVLLVGLGLRLLADQDARRQNLRAAVLGVTAAVAAWLHPIALPSVAAASAVVCVVLMVRGRLVPPALLLATALVVGAMPLLCLPRDVSWSWQRFAGWNVRLDFALLCGRVLPGLFTPDVDWAIPPTPGWILAIGWVWLIAWIVATVRLVAVVVRRAGGERSDRGPLVLLLASAGGACGAMSMVDQSYVSPYTLLPLYPLASMVIAVALEHGRRAGQSTFAALVAAALLASGLSVQVAAIGPPMIHGAGEQNRRVSAQTVDVILADLARHEVRCVFSESPTLQWNLMFESRERVTARWVNASDRWQPYVDRVNAAYLSGAQCALLMRVGGLPDRLDAVNASKQANRIA